MISPATLRRQTTGLMICSTGSAGMCGEAACVNGAARQGARLLKLCFSPRDLAGPKGVTCLCGRPERERSSTSAHFLPWTFSCTWKCSWRLWSAAPTPTCTHGASVWKITVRNVLLRPNTLNIFYTSHFLCSRCCHGKRWLLFRFVGGIEK